MDLIIKINVSGKRYEITKTTLDKIPYFVNLLKDCGEENKEIFVERSAMIFDHVLAYIIDDKHPFPLEYCYELYFYGINYNKSDVYRIIITEKQYQLSLGIIKKIPYLLAIVKSNDNDNSIPIYLQRSSILFDHVLAFVMNPKYLFPLEYCEELDYYNIIYNKNKLYDVNKSNQENFDVVKNILHCNQRLKGSYRCNRKGCHEDITGDKLYCQEHSKKDFCFVYQCRNKTIISNVCETHFDETDDICHFRDCGFDPIENKQYCYLHDK